MESRGRGELDVVKGGNKALTYFALPGSFCSTRYLKDAEHKNEKYKISSPREFVYPRNSPHLVSNIRAHSFLQNIVSYATNTC